MDTGLGNGDSLLFHDFMDSYTINIVHLVKLVDTHDTSVSQDHGTSLEMLLSSVLVNGYCSSETDA